MREGIYPNVSIGISHLLQSIGFGDNPDMSKLIDRLTSQMAVLGLNPSSAARAAHLQQGYVRDILRGRIREPSGLKLSQLAIALQCSPGYLMGLRSEPGTPERKFENEFPTQQMLRVAHQLRAGMFEEIDEARPEPNQAYSVFYSYEHAEFSQWLEKMMDSSANRVVPPNYLVHVVDAIEIEYKPSQGDLVIVERYRDEGELVERTLRQVSAVTGPNGTELVFPSHNPRWDHRITVGPGTEEAKIVGKVMFAYGGLPGSLNAK
jgi:transcriptional regulator with XRE-family HTH domain